MCSHAARLVIHRSDADEHGYAGAHEAECLCRPVTVCPVCDLSTVQDACYIDAPAEVVEAFRVERAARRAGLN